MKFVDIERELNELENKLKSDVNMAQVRGRLNDLSFALPRVPCPGGPFDWATRDQLLHRADSLRRRADEKLRLVNDIKVRDEIKSNKASNDVSSSAFGTMGGLLVTDYDHNAED